MIKEEIEMKWTQEELEKLYKEVNEKAAKDPEFLKKLMEKPKETMEELAGCELPEGFVLEKVAGDSKYAAAYMVPDFSGGELDRKALKSVPGGLSAVLIATICAAAVSVGACGADTCAAAACVGDYCAGNLCAAAACAAAGCAGDAEGVSGCAENVGAGTVCGAAGCAVDQGCAGATCGAAGCASNQYCAGYGCGTDACLSNMGCSGYSQGSSGSNPCSDNVCAHNPLAPCSLNNNNLDYAASRLNVPRLPGDPENIKIKQ